MILADKIITLRKQNGMSQEELAERMNVSRQSVSKWEGAQSAPDLNRILQLSEIFGVSTDVLLKDEMELAPTAQNIPDETEPPLRNVSMETANTFLQENHKSAMLIALGIACCIMCVVPGRLLEHLQPYGEMLSGVSLFLLIAAGVTLILIGSNLVKPYEFLEHEGIDTAYGVSGMVREKQNQRKTAHLTQKIGGIVLCIISFLPTLITEEIFGEDSFPASFGNAMTFALIACGVFFLVRSGIINGGFEKLLEEGGFTREEKAAQKSVAHTIITVYWLVIVAGYLGYSFLSGRWDISWIVFPIAGVLCGALAAILRHFKH